MGGRTVKTMKAMMKRFYESEKKGERKIHRHENFSVARWFGNIEFQIIRGNQPVVECTIVDGKAVIRILSDDMDEYMPAIMAVVAEHHNIA